MTARIFGMVTTKDSGAYTPYAVSSYFATVPPGPRDRFFLIDNDGAFDEATLREFDQVTFLRNEQRRSFAENANLLRDKALENRADLVLLNNDLIFTPDWFSPVAAAPEDIVSPFSNAEAQYELRGLVCKFAMDHSDYLGHEEKLGEIAAHHRARVAGRRLVLSLPFFCVRLSLRALEQLGPLDTAFGPGGAEDRDYCLRAHLAGLSVAYAAESYVLHFQGKSTWRGAETAEQTRARDEAYLAAFEQKWGGPLTRLFVLSDYRVLEEFGLRDAARAGRFREVVEQLQRMR